MTSRSNRHRSGKAAIVAVLILAIIASVLARQAAVNHRGKTASAVSAAAPGKSLSSMNSYAIALLLGGLRGPLVMFLWPSAETQKSERNLEDFDTKIEWIRLLQAEFDTVHIFQIWNKAYNISVQMANVANKYTTILDALEYAHNVDRERPNNVNILAAIGGIYFDKFGTSQERNYYKRQVRAQTLPHEMRQKISRNEAGWRRLELDPMLDAQGNILPELLKPGTIKLTDEKSGEVYDGSELEYLTRFQPFPDGFSPFALAYNYYKRSQLLQEAGKQRHAQLSDLVIDSRPALALKNWAEDESKFGRRCEIAAAGKPPVDDDDALDEPTESLPPNFTFPADALPKVNSAIVAYGKSVTLVAAAEVEYERHTARYAQNMMQYRQHRDELAAVAAISAGDRDYLRAILETDSAKKSQLVQSSVAGYLGAMDAANVLILRYYVSPELAGQLFPAGITRETISQISPEDRGRIVSQVLKLMDAGQMQESESDIREYLRPVLRAQTRLKLMGIGN